MQEKLISLFMAIYLFFACLPYGNQPVKVDFTYEMETTQEVYTAGDMVSVYATCKNKGRPFLGWEDRCVSCSFFLESNGERKYLRLHIEAPTDMGESKGQPALIRSGKEYHRRYSGTLLESCIPGVYSLEIQCVAYDGSVYQQVFENIIEVR